MSIYIAKTVNSDIPDILDIQNECNLSKWSFQDYREEIVKDSSIFLTAKFGSQTTGFLLARCATTNPLENYSEKSAEVDILNFGVSVKFRKQGIGNLLFENLLDKLTAIRLETIWLEVRETNFEAISFYKKRGFAAVQTRKNFYRHPTENAVLMKWEKGILPPKSLDKT